MPYKLQKTVRLAFIGILKTAVLLAAVVFLTLLIFSFTNGSGEYRVMQWVVISVAASFLFLLISFLIQHINFKIRLFPPESFEEDDQKTSTFIINTPLPDAIHVLENRIPLVIKSSLPNYDSINGLYTLRTWDSPAAQAECIFIKLHALNLTKTMVSVTSRTLTLSGSGNFSNNSIPVKKIKQVFQDIS
ncbi:MAG: hypothetical protein QM781_16030 [Chitinophagaceae bacterium]